MTTLKNSNCDKTKKHKLWLNSKTQILTKHKNLIMTKLNNSNCDKTQKLKWWKKLKNSNCEKLKNSNCEGEKTQNSNCDSSNSDGSDGSNTINILVKTTRHLYNRWDILRAAFRDSCDVFLLLLPLGGKALPQTHSAWYKAMVTGTLKNSKILSV